MSALFSIPDSWAWVTLGEIADVVSGVAKDSKRQSDPRLSQTPYLRVANVQRGYLDLNEVSEIRVPDSTVEKLRLEPGDVLLNEGGDRDKLGRGWIWQGQIPNCIHQNHVFRARLLGSLHPKLLAWYANEMARDWFDKSASQSVNLASISLSTIRRLPVPLPPTGEQHRIVAVLEDRLSRIEFGIGQLVKLNQRIDRFRDSLMIAASTGKASIGFNPVMTAGVPSLASSIDGELPEIPEHWRWVRLGEIAEVVGGVTKNSKRQADRALPEVPYLRVANVQRGRLDLSSITYIRVPPQKAKRLELQPGDVLLNEGGDRDKLGRGWVWEGQIPGCIHQNHVFRARIREGALHPKLLAWHANGFGRHWCEVNGKQSVNLASISLSKIRLLPVPVPPPEEQERLVADAERYLTLLDITERMVLGALVLGHKLRSALLTDAFAGRLVEQDPADEPSLMLLERIRAERPTQVPTQRIRRGGGWVAPKKEVLL